MCNFIFNCTRCQAEIDNSKYSFTNVLDGKITRTIDDGDFTIEIVTEEGYQITGCGSNSNFMSCSCENNVCTVDVHNYGRDMINIALANSD